MNWADVALTNQPKFLPSLRVKAAACALLGRLDEAQAIVRSLRMVYGRQAYQKDNR